MTDSPALVYRARLEARRATHAVLARIDARYSYARLTLFLAGAAAAGLALNGTLAWWPAAAALGAFLVLVARHDVIVRRLAAAARAVAFYERGLARVEDRWAGSGEAGERFRDERHCYANDLDLFGRGSLFELLSVSRTRAGEETLARWLTAPAEASEDPRPPGSRT